MRKSFFEYLMLKEASEQEKPSKGISSEVKLSDDSDYKPFIVNDEQHPNLRAVVQAFLDSQKVAFPGPDGYPQKLTTLDPGKGETTPKLKKKGLYLTGGAVRDHLSGKTPKNYDLVTDAAPDEIRLILRSAGFHEVKPQGKHAQVDKRYEKHPDAGTKAKVYWAKGWDRSGREFVMGARVNGEEFEIATFRKDSKGSTGRMPEKMEFGGLEDDSGRRDFTINAMYIPLTSADGPNAKLIDPHGGAHHLKAGDVRFIGNPKDRLDEDQLRALRYIRFVSKYNSTTTIPEEYKAAIHDVKDLQQISREDIREEFVKGLEHPDVDPKKYIKYYKDFGLLKTVFPGMVFKLDDPKKDFTDKKDKRLVVAFVLRHNNPDDIKDMLGHGAWPESEVNDILHLIKMCAWAASYGKNDDEFYSQFYDMKNDLHTKTSLVPSVLRQWGQMCGMDEDMTQHYIQHELGTKAYVKDSFGNRAVNPEITQALGGRTPSGREFTDTIKGLETNKFKSKFAKDKKKAPEGDKE